jgi:hypothetical protein
MNNSSINALGRRIDAALALIEEKQRAAEEEDIASLVIYDPATGKPLPGYEQASAKEGIVFWFPKRGGIAEGYTG